MNKTEKLKKIILNRYSSIREFAKIAGIPSTTLTSSLDRGIGGMAVDRIIKICEILNIDVKTFDPLESITSNGNLSEEEIILLDNYNKLNNKGKGKLLDYSDDLVTNSRYINDYMPLAAHANEGATKEDIQHDLNIMNDDSEW